MKLIRNEWTLAYFENVIISQNFRRLVMNISLSLLFESKTIGFVLYHIKYSFRMLSFTSEQVSSTALAEFDRVRAIDQCLVEYLNKYSLFLENGSRIGTGFSNNWLLIAITYVSDEI